MLNSKVEEIQEGLEDVRNLSGRTLGYLFTGVLFGVLTATVFWNWSLDQDQSLAKLNIEQAKVTLEKAVQIEKNAKETENKISQKLEKAGSLLSSYKEKNKLLVEKVQRSHSYEMKITELEKRLEVLTESNKVLSRKNARIDKKNNAYKKTIANLENRVTTITKYAKPKLRTDFGVGYSLSSIDAQGGVLDYQINYEHLFDKKFNHVQSELISYGNGKEVIAKTDTVGVTDRVINTVKLKSSSVGINSFKKDFHFVSCNKFKGVNSEHLEYSMSIFAGYVDSEMLPNNPDEALHIISKGRVFPSTRKAMCLDAARDFLKAVLDE